MKKQNKLLVSGLVAALSIPLTISCCVKPKNEIKNSGYNFDGVINGDYVRSWKEGCDQHLKVIKQDSSSKHYIDLDSDLILEKVITYNSNGCGGGLTREYSVDTEYWSDVFPNSQIVDSKEFDMNFIKVDSQKEFDGYLEKILGIKKSQPY